MTESSTPEAAERYETAYEQQQRLSYTDSVVCTECGVFVMNRAAHDRHHGILDRQAVALAVLGAAHFSADVHDRYDTADRIGWKDGGGHEPELDAGLCWIWWEGATHQGHHRCTLGEGHMGLHRCCCDEETPFGNRTAFHRHEPGTPCLEDCPGRGRLRT